MKRNQVLLLALLAAGAAGAWYWFSQKKTTAAKSGSSGGGGSLATTNAGTSGASRVTTTGTSTNPLLSNIGNILSGVSSLYSALTGKGGSASSSKGGFSMGSSGSSMGPGPSRSTTPNDSYLQSSYDDLVKGWAQDEADAQRAAQETLARQEAGYMSEADLWASDNGWVFPGDNAGANYDPNVGAMNDLVDSGAVTNWQEYEDALYALDNGYDPGGDNYMAGGEY